ncbi:hypothetical protein [Caldimonas manganoxidans]|nr:hypothetical protein [Caldimonas manganoxidans]
MRTSDQFVATVCDELLAHRPERRFDELDAVVRHKLKGDGEWPLQPSP